MSTAFASFGAKVTVAGRSRERLEAAAQEIRPAAREGGEVDLFAADVRDPAQVDALVAFAAGRFGKIDGLVNNAAGNFLVAAEELTPNDFSTVCATVRPA